MSSPRLIVFVLVDGMELLDLAGPHAVFTNAEGLSDPPYAVETLGAEPGLVTCAGGTRIAPTCDLSDAPAPDTLIVVGGAGVRTYAPDDAQAEALRRLAGRARRVVSVCTGAFLLARLGLLDGRRVATHWRHAKDLAEAFPAVDVDDRALYLKSGPVYSSAGITAGIDLALALLREDHGDSVAAAVARQLVVHLHRAGDQAQFHGAAPDRRAARFVDLLDHITRRPDDDLSVPALARRAGMSERSFTRAFSADLGLSPARYVERVRLDQACAALAARSARIDQVARASGFASPDSFRRAFERRFGVAPSTYQKRFGS